MRWLAILIIFASAIVILASLTSSGKTIPLALGDKVEIIGRGYYNPYCYGNKGFWWDFNEPTNHYLVCERTRVPGSGIMRIEKSVDGYWVNNCIRACDVFGRCGWYPISSLKKVG